MKINRGYLISKFIRLINRPALRNCYIDRTSKVGTGSNCIAVQMGRYSYMGKNNSVTNTKIGSFCSIASYCAIGGGDHCKTMISTSPVFVGYKNIFRKNFGHAVPDMHKEVIIGHDVWIGENVFINDGLNIGNGAIIGAHSVVTHDVPPYSIVAGSPAKIIRYRFSPEDVDFIERTKWWEWSEEKLIKNGPFFNSIEDFKGIFN
ncbi:MAG TPA: CatB-related O-acetyltransferase [Candidatus Coprenecus pullistercoris]|nr:CatB-related O-acetyltransferase [Candidatus Coprenecus pullistercoris]